MVDSRVVTLLLAAAALGELTLDDAAADVDVEVPLALSAKGTLVPAGDVDTYRLDATNGTLLGFQAVSDKGARMTFAAHLFDANDAEVVIQPALVTTSAKKFSVKNLPITATGAYRLEISASGTGEYSLRLTGKPASRFSGSLTVPAAGDARFAFSAPAGSRVTLTATAASGSQAVPRFGVLSGDGVDLDLAGSGKLTSTSHTVVLASVGGTGDLSVGVASPGAAGDVAVTASVKVPKVKTLKVDSRGVVRGRPEGGESVVVRGVGTSGGTVEVADGASDIDGAAVVIPPGALGGGTTITIASAAPLAAADGDQASGPSIFLGPPGVTFAVPVEVLVPYDPALIPVDQTPQDLRVLVVERDGSSSIRPPASVDVLGRTVTVEANGFSTFVVIARAGQQPLGVRPGGDAFWLLGLYGHMDADPSNDSRRRRFALETGEATYRSGGVFDLATTERFFSYDNTTTVAGDRLDGNLVISSVPHADALTWSYGPDGRTVVVTDPGGSTTFATSADGNYQVASGGNSGDTGAEELLLVRKNSVPLTAGGVAGTYHLVLLGIGADDRGPAGGVFVQTYRAAGTWVFEDSGRFRVSGSQRGSDLTAAGGATTVLEKFSLSGTFAVEAAGTVAATFPPTAEDPATVFRFFPGPGGAVLFGTDRDPDGPNLQALVLVREGTGLGNGTLTGAYRGAEFDAHPNPYNVPSSAGGSGFHIADFAIGSADLEMDFSGRGSLSLVVSDHSSRRDTSVAGGLLVQNQTEPSQVVGSKVEKNGKFTVTVPGENATPYGAVTPDGMFGCAVTNVAGGSGDNYLMFFVKLPPAR